MPTQTEVPKRVLIADDDAAIRDRFSEAFALDGWEVSTAADGASVVEGVRAQNPSVVVLDLRMPKKDGVKVLEELHAEFPWTQVVVLTGHGEEEDAIRCLNNGAFKYLRKPASINELVRVGEAARSNVPLALWALHSWFTNLPDPDHVVFQTSSGQTVSARTLMESVRKQAPEGREFVQHVLEVAIELIGKRLK